MNLLEIKDLSIHYVTKEGTFKSVNHVNLELEEGETIGLVGETGAGKTTTALGILRLLQSPPAKIVSGEILFKGTDLLKVSEDRHDLPGSHDGAEPDHARGRPDHRGHRAP